MMKNIYKNTSLCILVPTYKRPEQLRDCIFSVFNQVKSTEVSMVVIDDSVSDINKDVICWAKNLPSFKFSYIKNPTNVGIDKNIENCLNFDECQYILVLGEDDIIMPGALDCLLNIIRSSDNDIIYTSYVYIDNLKGKIIRNPLVVSGLINPNYFLENYLWAIGFIGSLVIKCEFIKRNNKRYLGTYFNHVGRVAVNVDENTKIFSSPVSIVGNRSDDINTATWSKNYYDVLFGFERLMDELGVDKNQKVIFQKSKKNLRKKFGYMNLHRIIVMRSYGIYNVHIYKRYISNNSSIHFKFIALLISLVPKNFLFFVKPMLFVAKKIKRWLCYPASQSIK